LTLLHKYLKSDIHHLLLKLRRIYVKIF